MVAPEARHPPRARLLITVDYELFGDGSGCLEHCVLAPGQRILDLAERHGFRVTLFVEALEFAALEEGARTAAEREASRRVREQLIEARQRGHDIQLHLHPQWLDATREDDGSWKLDFRRWRLGDLDPGLIDRAVGRGASWLVDVLRAVDPEYAPRAFRAGAWCIQPIERVLPALVAHGIVVDSTVAPGLRNAARGDWFDFRSARDLPWWSLSAAAVDETAVLELPIAVSTVPFRRNLSETVARKLSRSSDLAPGCAGSYAGPNSGIERLRGKLSKLLGLRRAMLDISTASATLMEEVAHRWIEAHAAAEVTTPLVAIGHTKNFTERSAAALDAYLERAREMNIVGGCFEDCREDIAAASEIAHVNRAC